MLLLKDFYFLVFLCFLSIDLALFWLLRFFLDWFEIIDFYLSFFFLFLFSPPFFLLDAIDLSRYGFFFYLISLYFFLVDEIERYLLPVCFFFMLELCYDLEAILFYLTLLIYNTEFPFFATALAPDILITFLICLELLLYCLF